MDRGVEWRVPDRAERESIVSSDPDLREVMRWLGDTAELTFKSRVASPAVFSIGIPKWSFIFGVAEDTTEHFLNWKVTYFADEPTYVGEGDYMEDPDDPEKHLVNKAGREVMDEEWERITHVRVKLYNKGDAHFTNAQEFVQARKRREFEFQYRLYDRSRVEPSDIENEEGVTLEDAEDALYAEIFAPPIKFEQQDDDGAFLTISDPKYESIVDEGDVPQRVVTTQHRLRLFKTMLERDMPRPIALMQVHEAFKDAYVFNAKDFISGFGWVDADFVNSELIIRKTDREDVTRRIDVKDFSMWSFLYRQAEATRRRPGRPLTQPGEGKQEKTEAPFRIQAKCSFCNRRKATAACDGCGEAKYCGAQCQKIAWSFDGHDKSCRS